ncbi:nuclear transport factor 2 family protein [Mycolicibacterium boenickei]|nr:nuclear transport factor 2 family protein [Mycolicibacterium boenickei]
MDPDLSFENRLRRIEDTLAIQQLPIRYAIAVDERDIDAWIDLFTPDVQVGRDTYGREALRDAITSMTKHFYRSIHQIVGHRIDLVDAERANGNVYCRAEHEVGEQWIVMAIRYDDTYRKVGGQWHFSERKERHWYAADLTQRPESVAFSSWHMAGRANLPKSSSWEEFWAYDDVSALTSSPINSLLRSAE